MIPFHIRDFEAAEKIIVSPLKAKLLQHIKRKRKLLKQWAKDRDMTKPDPRMEIYVKDLEMLETMEALIELLELGQQKLKVVLADFLHSYSTEIILGAKLRERELLQQETIDQLIETGKDTLKLL